MLVLARRERQQIRIAENITLTVIEIKKGVVRLGIDAPKEINVARLELLGKDTRDRKS